MYKIAVIPGDGTGPEVTAEAVKVLGRRGPSVPASEYETTHFDFGGDRYLRTNEVLARERRRRPARRSMRSFSAPSATRT